MTNNCPQCNTPKKSAEAKFCNNCGFPFSQDVSQITSVQPPTLRVGQNDKPSNTQRLPSREMNLRGEGEIFNNRYLFQSAIFSDQQNHYLVTEPGDRRKHNLQLCSQCGFSAPGNRFEPACPVCKGLDWQTNPTWLLIESREPFAPSMDTVIQWKFNHPHLRPPVDGFIEDYQGENLHYLVMPRFREMPASVELVQALKWAVDLAKAMDYIHASNRSFNGNIDTHNLGLDYEHEKPVWVNLYNCTLLPSKPNPAICQQDLRAFSQVIYQLVTAQGKASSVSDLPSALQGFFAQALGETGFSSGEDFASALEQALSEFKTTASVMVRTGKCTHVGRVRKLNEDSLLVIELHRYLQSNPLALGVYLVADGMGGHDGGEIASKTLVDVIARKSLQGLSATLQLPDDISRWTVEAVKEANKVLYELRTKQKSNMGSTLVMAVLYGTRAYIAHVGDSRAYQVNQEKIKQLTTDHSLVEKLVAAGKITREEAATHPQSSAILRSMGDTVDVEVDTTTCDLKPGDRLLLCSDGLTGFAKDDLIHQKILSAGDPQTACTQLIETANNGGGEDNITAILVEITSI